MKNLGVLVVEFFELYGRFFQYEHVGLSLRSGGHYFHKQTRGWSNPNSPGLLSIEDPQDPTNDVSSGSYGFQRVKGTLGGAFELLSAALCLRGSELEDKEKSRKLGRKSPAELSLLSSIMGITQDVGTYIFLCQALKFMTSSPDRIQKTHCLRTIQPGRPSSNLGPPVTFIFCPAKTFQLKSHQAIEIITSEERRLDTHSLLFSTFLQFG